MRKPEIINKLRNACKSCQNRRRKDKRKTQIKSAGTVNEVISAIACVGVFVALVYWCLPAKSSDALLMIERPQLLEEIDNKGGFLGVAVDTLQVLDEIPQDSVTRYSSSLIQMEGQYKIYEVIYHIHYMDCDRYFLCNVLKNKRKGSRDEIRLVKESSQLMDLDSVMVVRCKL